MEFFLQTLVKKKYMSQLYLIRLQWVLMLASSMSAGFVLVYYVRWGVGICSHLLNLVNRGHDLANTCLVLAGALVYDYCMLQFAEVYEE
jgi:hypothetical protein